MSRIGKNPVVTPSSVTATVDGTDSEVFSGEQTVQCR